VAKRTAAKEGHGYLCVGVCAWKKRGLARALPLKYENMIKKTASIKRCDTMLTDEYNKASGGVVKKRELANGRRRVRRITTNKAVTDCQREMIRMVLSDMTCCQSRMKAPVVHRRAQTEKRPGQIAGIGVRSR